MHFVSKSGTAGSWASFYSAPSLPRVDASRAGRSIGTDTQVRHSGDRPINIPVCIPQWNIYCRFRAALGAPVETATRHMKVFLIYDHASDPALHHKLAITLPTKWLEQSCDKVKETFVNAYNKKFPDNQLDDEDFVLSVKDSSPFTNRDYKLLTISDTPAKAFEDKGEVRLVPAPPANAGQPGVLPNGKSRCKNYGCQCEYTEAENSESACRHHAARPIFHDTRKWWSCCDGVKVYSFDELLSIPGCEVGRHSSVPPLEEQQREAEMKAATNKVLEMHMAASKPDAQGKAPPPKQDFTPSAPPKPRPKPNLPPGYARCKHHGCQKDYLIESNTGNTCVYHKQAPVFHEGAKKWTCCGVSRWDFDDFLAVPGCAVGPHEPVE